MLLFGQIGDCMLKNIKKLCIFIGILIMLVSCNKSNEKSYHKSGEEWYFGVNEENIMHAKCQIDDMNVRIILEFEKPNKSVIFKINSKVLNLAVNGLPIDENTSFAIFYDDYISFPYLFSSNSDNVISFEILDYDKNYEYGVIVEEYYSLSEGKYIYIKTNII